MTATVHEAHARHVKATAIADVLDAAGADPTAIDDVAWRLAARIAGVHEPSARTRDLVVAMLAERARLRDGDPFDLPEGA